jgi:hypothetical protein
LSRAWIRIQLSHAAPASQFLTVFASAGAVFQTNDRFEHIPFLAHPLEAHFAIDTATQFSVREESQNGPHDSVPRISDSDRRLWFLSFKTAEAAANQRDKLVCQS